MKRTVKLLVAGLILFAASGSFAASTLQTKSASAYNTVSAVNENAGKKDKSEKKAQKEAKKQAKAEKKAQKNSGTSAPAKTPPGK